MWGRVSRTLIVESGEECGVESRGLLLNLEECGVESRELLLNLGRRVR